MRALLLGAVMLPLAAVHPALAQSAWLESARMDAAQIRELCQQVSDIRMLARMQMIASGDAQWLRLSRQDLTMEAAVMGAPPLDPGRCYVIVRAGRSDGSTRRAFEVREFAVNPERTSVFAIGRSYDPPSP